MDGCRVVAEGATMDEVGLTVVGGRRRGTSASTAGGGLVRRESVDRG